ncbi:CLUMA_CG006234, isoform A [Clunio marinus]|uniref:CLUMA_CG006234, isoform A n=1 Tax=Clunio marinus TaxID=568069 RepID=A0A1J1HYW9_9DIPT|nr:CLUMA_CG006234, isoform A [Clunio marinus]
MNPLFACSRCFKRYPFEEIFASSNEDMFCGECRNATAKSKCTYCRSEFQQTGKSSNACPRCLANLKLYGKPSACSLCSINAAFKTDKCHRCTSSEYKFGPAVKCEICQQICAFNRENHRVDGKLHCWLCKLSYKRALAKAKSSENDKHRQKKRSADEAGLKLGGMHKLSNAGSSNNRSGNNSSQHSKSNMGEIPEKIAKSGNSGNPSNSDHIEGVVDLSVITQLREQIATLQKKLQQKDNQLLQKDKEITDWKGKHFTIETEMRNKMKDQERLYETKLEVLNKKVQNQLREIAQLSKSQKRIERTMVTESGKIEKQNNNSSSGNDSPNTN